MSADTVWVKFPIRYVVASLSGIGDAPSQQMSVAERSVVIWTTTPWTIPGNRAISYSPKIEYGLYEVTDAPADNWAKVGDRFILADKLAIDVLRQARVTAYNKVAPDQLLTY